MFSDHPDIKRVMARYRFLKIRACLNLKVEGVAIDPLHSARRLLDEVSKSFCKVAVPTGTSALDESSCRSKARNRAISYLPSKPDNFALRFYCVVGKKYFTTILYIEQTFYIFIFLGTDGPYVHSIFDNGRGYQAPISNAERYNHLHKIFGQILKDKLGPGSTIEKSAASALWLLQLIHQTKIYRLPNSSRVLFCDNFYTRPELCQNLLEVSDGDVKMTGTCKFSNIDAINRPVILDGI